MNRIVRFVSNLLAESRKFDVYLTCSNCGVMRKYNFPFGTQILHAHPLDWNSDDTKVIYPNTTEKVTVTCKACGIGHVH